MSEAGVTALFLRDISIHKTQFLQRGFMLMSRKYHKTGHEIIDQLQ